MNRLIFSIAFLLGAAAILWMSASFIGTDNLALTVTLVIGCVYTIGFIELLQFRQATATLTGALSALPDTASAHLTPLEQWLEKLHPSLQNAVRLRIEGERVGLPAPVITPYLVGLLVMLGLLGTFVGMVYTLKGAVFALEGTTELQAIRAGLAAPINGLSLAFGTSVAGVAASAMLGLVSTLSRRDRMLETRRLDSSIAGVFRDYSLTHNRRETFRALQQQAQTLPDVAQRLHAMAEKIERMGDTLGDKLIDNQNLFHESVQGSYAELAVSIDQSLKQSLADSGRVAGESIQPIVASVMAGMSEKVLKTHEQLALTAQDQLSAYSAHAEHTATQMLGTFDEATSQSVERLQNLEATVATHLAALGKELEAPMARLIETASETPRAAAEVIGHLRREISNTIERDNALLAERKNVMEQLNTLSGSLATMSEATDYFSGSVIQMSSLGETFALAVNLFNDSNSTLIEHLSKIEESMEKSTSRSDEQMGYYVAQAREIIDQSMMSQREMFEGLRQLGEEQGLTPAAAS